MERLAPWNGDGVDTPRKANRHRGLERREAHLVRSLDGLQRYRAIGGGEGVGRDELGGIRTGGFRASKTSKTAAVEGEQQLPHVMKCGEVAAMDQDPHRCLINEAADPSGLCGG